MTTIRGRDLQVGDTVITWFGRQTIVRLAPYAGPLADLRFSRIAEFASGHGMTMLDEMVYDIVALQREVA